MKVTLDIETLGTPELSGYGIVVPSFAFVEIPENFEDGLSKWIYIVQGVQKQLDKGLKVDSGAMKFWFDVSDEFPNAQKEMLKSFSTSDHYYYDNTSTNMKCATSASEAVYTFFGGKPEEVYGCGCNFDCSILQENFRVLYNYSKVWNYPAPQNVRTLRLLLSSDETLQMKRSIEPILDAFKPLDNMELHHALYDAAKEALQVSYILNLKKTK